MSKIMPTHTSNPFSGDPRMVTLFLSGLKRPPEHFLLSFVGPCPFWANIAADLPTAQNEN